MKEYTCLCGTLALVKSGLMLLTGDGPRPALYGSLASPCVYAILLSRCMTILISLPALRNNVSASAWLTSRAS